MSHYIGPIPLSQLGTVEMATFKVLPTAILIFSQKRRFFLRFAAMNQYNVEVSHYIWPIPLSLGTVETATFKVPPTAILIFSRKRRFYSPWTHEKEVFKYDNVIHHTAHPQ